LKVDLSKPLPETADAADFLESGITWDEFRAWAKPLIRIYQKKPEIITATAIVETEKIEAKAQANVVNIINTDDAPFALRSQYDLWKEMKLMLTKGDQPCINYENVVRALNFHNPLKGIVWFDEFHDKVYTQDPETKVFREWNDNDDTELSMYFQGTLGLAKMSRDVIRPAIMAYAKRNKKNEPKDWFETLKHDGEDRLSHFFEKYFGAEYNAYTHKAAMNFWVGMIARVYRPGCKNDHMVVLEGPQGVGKSRAMEVIGGPWYAESNESVHTKDFYMVLQGKILIEIAELDSFNKAEVTRIKQVISCPMDRYRGSYDRRPSDHYRTCVFCGTTNEGEYLRDTTGGRRFWPITTKHIDIEALSRDRDQLFAQAVIQFKQGDDWWRMPDKETKQEQEFRRQVDERTPLVERYLVGKNQTTIPDIAMECLGIDKGDIPKHQQAIGKMLATLGFVRIKNPVSDKVGHQIRVWNRSVSCE